MILGVGVSATAWSVCVPARVLWWGCEVCLSYLFGGQGIPRSHRLPGALTSLPTSFPPGTFIC